VHAGHSLFDLTGRVAVVTGAGQGFGRTFALGLARYGADVVILELDADKGAATAGEVKQLGRIALSITADVSNKDQVEAAFARIDQELGRLDVLVNNAGIWRPVPALELSLEQWDRVVAVNLTGALLCMQAAGRRMVPRQRGSIVNISSISGVQGRKNGAAYAATKHGILGLTKSFAHEWALDGVRVNAIGPGAHETEMTRVWRDDPETLQRQLLSKIPMGRLGDPEELGSADFPRERCFELHGRADDLLRRRLATRLDRMERDPAPRS
jgi:NAD(P)-dependent dehydrogenase (short-subunit alcohol dehydrogenase family)